MTVQSHPQPEFAPAEPVMSPPPPAQIEHFDAVPPAPGCVWADGQWVWALQRWDWRPGGWIRPPEGCRYSAPTTIWAPSSNDRGTLYYRAGRWYSVTEPKVCPEPVSCVDGSASRPASSPRIR